MPALEEYIYFVASLLCAMDVKQQTVVNSIVGVSRVANMQLPASFLPVPLGGKAVLKEPYTQLFFKKLPCSAIWNWC
jgi:hypothetical protein